MTKRSIEDQIIALRREGAKVIKKLELKENALIRKLRACSHKHVRPWNWEHDNGYGGQTTIAGEQCIICYKRRGWAGAGPWYSDEEIS